MCVSTEELTREQEDQCFSPKKDKRAGEMAHRVKAAATKLTPVQSLGFTRQRGRTDSPGCTLQPCTPPQINKCLKKEELGWEPVVV